MDGNPSEIPLSDQLRASAANEVAQQYKDLASTDPLEFIKLCHKKFCEKKIAMFPYMCEIARTQNLMKWKELEETSNRGKYTGTAGWSEKGHFKFQFEIPQELYNFMQNLVYHDFWEPHNKKIADRFMNSICKGADPISMLRWVRSHYGAEMGKVTGHGM